MKRLRNSRITISLLMLSGFGMLTSCGQWRSTSLSPHRYAMVPSGDKAGQVSIKADSYGFENLSMDVKVFNGLICTVDNELKRFQVLQKDNDIDLVIGNTAGIDRKKIKAVNFKFGTIGTFYMDENDTIYIQNRFEQIQSFQGNYDSTSVDFSPSFLLVFNSDGELQYTLGQRGTPDLPFYYIESLKVDSSGRLFVLSRSVDSWTVYRFNGKKRDFYLNLSKLEFKETEGKETYQGRIENVRIFEDGQNFLISVAYYYGLRLKYIKVYQYSIAAQKITRTIINIPDPKNVLFDIVNDKYLYFWNITDNDVKFIICNLSGDIVNNLFLKMDKKKYHQSRLFTDGSGNFYSYFVSGSGIEVTRWE